MTRTTRFASIALSVSLLSGALIALTAVAAEAHTPAVSATCSKLTVSLQSYSTTQNNPKPNKVTVVIDTTTPANESFGTTFSREFSLGDAAVAHTYKVTIDAVDNGYDRTFTGTSTPCTPQLPKDAAAALHTTPATCAAAGTLVLDSVVNATWSAPTLSTGPGDYSVTATATKGHLFDDGTAKRAFTGSLPAPLAASSAECAPRPTPTVPKPKPPVVKPVVPAKPAPADLSSRTVSIDCDARTVTTTTTTTRTDWVLDTAGTTWVAAEPVITVSTSDRPASSTTCTPTTPVVSPENGGGGTGAGDGSGDGTGAGNGAGAGEVGGIVGSVFGLESLAHAGTDAVLAILLGLAAVAIGVVAVSRRRRPSTEG